MALKSLTAFHNRVINNSHGNSYTIKWIYVKITKKFQSEQQGNIIHLLTPHKNVLYMQFHKS